MDRGIPSHHSPSVAIAKFFIVQISNLIDHMTILEALKSLKKIVFTGIRRQYACIHSLILFSTGATPRMRRHSRALVRVLVRWLEWVWRNATQLIACKGTCKCDYICFKIQSILIYINPLFSNDVFLSNIA